MLNINQTSQALEAFEKSPRIVCMCHSNPDGDALGALLGLVIIIRERFPQSTIVSICKDKAPCQFNYMKGVDEIINSYTPLRGDLFISIDAGDARQTGFEKDLPELFDPKKAEEKGITTMKIDHHHTGEMFAQMNFVDSSAASSAEIVADIADSLDFRIPKEAATCLLTGIYTDTGSLMHSNTSDRVYKTCSRLLKAGADHKTIIQNVYRTSKLSTLKLWGRVLEKISISDEGAAISAVTLGDFRASGASFAELTGAIDYVNSIPGMRFSLILSERKDKKVKGSIRTLREDVDVSEMAKRFGGGGHKKAAGFTLEGKLEEERRWKVVSPNNGPSSEA